MKTLSVSEQRKSRSNFGFVKMMRNEDDICKLFRLNRCAFFLLALISIRARYNPDIKDGLSLGEAKIGDFKKYGMTRQEWRTGRKLLKELSYVTLRATDKGTIAKIIDATIFDPLNSFKNKQADQPNRVKPKKQPRDVENPTACGQQETPTMTGDSETLNIPNNRVEAKIQPRDAENPTPNKKVIEEGYKKNPPTPQGGNGDSLEKDVESFSVLWNRGYEEATGVKYQFNERRDRTAVKDLLKMDYPPKKLLNIAAKAWESNKGNYPLNMALTIRGFYDHFSAINAEIKRIAKCESNPFAGCAV